MPRGDDIPEPSYWSRVKQLHAQGCNFSEIARRVGKNRTAVVYILRPDKREKMKELARARYKRTGQRGGTEYDNKRMQARQEARQRWRDEGRTRPLDQYYRELECL